MLPRVVHPRDQRYQQQQDRQETARRSGSQSNLISPGRAPVRSSTTSANSSYINGAFDFLSSPSYDAYKYYDSKRATGPEEIAVRMADKKSGRKTKPRAPISPANQNRRDSNATNQSGLYKKSMASSTPTNQAQAKMVAARLKHSKDFDDNKRNFCVEHYKSVLIFLLILAILAALVVAILYVAGVITIGGEEEHDDLVYGFNASAYTNLTWDDDYLDPNSTLYQELDAQFVQFVDDVFRDYDTYLETTVYSFAFYTSNSSEGSVWINYRTTFSVGVTMTIDTYISMQLDAVNVLTFDIYSINAIPISIPIYTATTMSPLDDVSTTDEMATTMEDYGDNSTATPEASFSTEQSTEGSVTTGDMMSTTTLEPPTYTPPQPEVVTPAPLSCSIIDQPLCTGLDYTRTGYPNIYGHANYLDSISTFQGLYYLFGMNCYDYMLEFACKVVYSPCSNAKLLIPCRRFCEEFKAACDYPITCELFPDDDDPDLCTLSPAADTTPEQPVPFVDSCAVNGRYRCGDGTCVDGTQCDNVIDCPDEYDELYCGEVLDLDCDFEQDTFCSYTQVTTDYADWEIHSGATPSIGTGPSYDTTVRDSYGKYCLAEASGKYAYEVMQLESPTVTIATDSCFRFFYHMRGEDVYSLKVFLTADANMTLLWQRTRHQGDDWKQALINITADMTGGVLTIEAIRGESYLSDIAIDNLVLRTGPCPPQECAADEFACNNGNCVLDTYVCDRKEDCGDYSDETDCVCESDEFQCEFGMCIPGRQRCDDLIQCADSSDEQNCDCPFGQYLCADESTCIMSEWLCDRDFDCPDHDDEENCPVCSSSEWQCYDYSCVDAALRCDGNEDCPDKSDEDECLRLEESTSLLQVYKSDTWHYVCDDGSIIDDVTLGGVCAALGKDSGGSFSLMSASYGSPYVVFNPDDDGMLLQGYFDISSTCAVDGLLQVDCADTECGVPDVQLSTYIIHGTDAADGTWPWQVAILFNAGLNCGGTLVSPQHVLTAAHCTNGLEDHPEMFSLMLGTISLTAGDDNQVIMGVKSVKVHEQYDQNAFYLGHDIAIFTLEQPVEFNEWIKPACLPDAYSTVIPTSRCYTLGWGFYDITVNAASDTLQQAKMKVIDTETCLEGHPNLQANMLCAGYDSGYITNCIGDSGGPLVCQDEYEKWQVQGVFSFVPVGCSVPGRPPVFTRTASFIDWISDNIACKFICDNTRCLVDEGDVCDGVDDCGDWSDETRTCVPEISCDFEEEYMCGWITVSDTSDEQWTRNNGPIAVNVGPLTDVNTGNNTGHYVWSGQNVGYLLSPVYDFLVWHCLTFDYHVRGPDPGRFSVFTQEVDDANTAIYNLMITNPNTLYTQDGQNSDEWEQWQVNIPAGTYVIGFQSVSPASDVDAYVAIDNVLLKAGTCESIECDFRCDGGGILVGYCHDESDLCNFRVDCSDLTDEDGCTDVLYECDMSEYGTCGWVQETADDTLDWSLETASTGFSNAPTTDATTDAPGGNYLWMSTELGTRESGSKAIMTLDIKAQDTTSCLSLYYNFIGTGTLRVFLTKSQAQLAWEYYSDSWPAWRQAQIPIPAGYGRITIEGVIGGYTNTSTQNYIALDDFTITPAPCSIPVCPLEEFTCNNGSCISSSKRCDGISQCSDGEDELYCPCPLGTFSCLASGDCLDSSLRCDGNTDCDDGSDETRCDLGCSDFEIQCDDQCKSYIVWCNGYNDCDDQRDEQPGCECLDYQMRCDSGECLSYWYYCDGNDLHCPDGSDEPDGCDACDPEWWFACTATGHCIEKWFVCDGYNQCGDYSDEVNCVCEDESEFQCDNSMCISPGRYCDGVPDCPDSEDEPPGCVCSEGYRVCANGGCIPQANWCDGLTQCPDKSDETDCGACSDDEFQCANGMCIAGGYQCDGSNSCGDFSDEINCGACPEHTCANGVCIDNLFVCDGQNDCGDESDERNCDCEDNEVQCADDGRCILTSWVCDGNADCDDAGDENNCPTCEVDEYQCINKAACISIAQRCDGVADCADQSDELFCLRMTSGYLEKLNGAEWVPVCSTGWQSNLAHETCTMIGQGTFLSSSESTFDTAMMPYFAYSGDGSSLDLQNFTLVDDAAEPGCGAGIQLVCNADQCGLRAEDIISSFIIGGNLASEGEYPWVAALYYLGGYQCSAALITNQWLLTAGHCIFQSGTDTRLDNVPQYFQVLLGTVDQSNREAPAVWASVEVINMHPDYLATGVDAVVNNDIAILKLTSAVTVNDYIRPLCLPHPDDIYDGSSLCYIAGWGYTNIWTSNIPSILRETRYYIKDEADCYSASFGAVFNSTISICAGFDTGTTSACLGDSGGPLLCREASSGRWAAVGLVSSGDAVCQTDSPTVFSKVSQYLDWIYENIYDIAL